jgi:hypothetical protein
MQAAMPVRLPGEAPISEITSTHVRALAEALNLALQPDDVDEITHRFNAFLHALAPIGDLPLDRFEPSPVTPESRT